MTSILILVHDNYEELELWYPKIRLEESGFQTILAGVEENKTYQAKSGYPCTTDASFDDCEASHFGGIVIPGGFSPDKLRRIPKVLELTRTFFEENKMVAFICHGGWVPISAKILDGKRVTGTTAIKDDLENAGGIWEDSPLVVDGNLISSRTPKDLHIWGKSMVEFLT